MRLLVWRWRELYDLGGDEREYFNQALTLLREHRYQELQLMRPPLYTFFLAGCIYLFDSLVQRLRLIQAIVSALTVVPVYLLARQLLGARRVALVAALLAALSYTLAANAAELLTETLFVFGLTVFFWLLLRAGLPGSQVDQAPSPKPQASTSRGQAVTRSPGHLLTLPPGHLAAALAGLSLGALVLLRSVALPLLPLGALWLLLVQTKDQGPRAEGRLESAGARASEPQTLSPKPQAPSSKLQWSRAIVFALAAVLAIAPWTIRNDLTYGAPILVDTTGAENLWLDNNPEAATPRDPLGREAAKRELYALGDDRAGRQRLAVARGSAAIVGHPAWFLQKSWGEAQKFFALEYFDDMRERRAIWLPPLEVWLRLLLGDGLWLVLLGLGAGGLWLYQGPRTKDQGPTTTGDVLLRELEAPSPKPQASSPRPQVSRFDDARWVLVPWALYTLLTAMVFHVELRYRLPLYPVLLPYAAWAICRIADCRLQIADWGRARAKIVYAGLTILALFGMTLLHRPYIRESVMLARKHVSLWQADRALDAGDAAGAGAGAQAALRLDPESALARVAQARAELARGQTQPALAALAAAIEALPAHPHAHLLRGAILRGQGDFAAARAELAYERASLEDLQGWAWRAFEQLGAAPRAVDVGGGLDLGYVRGFYLAETAGFRWSTAESSVLLAAPAGVGARLELRLNGGRPAGAAAPQVAVLVGGREVGRAAPASEWRAYGFAIPPELISADRRVLVTLRSDTFRPRDLDRASPDGRAPGVMVGRAEVSAP
ncbi:MAG: glycosyltransferase family 39 protein [Kouleothrix sp.]|nr:glycosyltransferase family 39 protein [Kouleothrix sp.]